MKIKNRSESTMTLTSKALLTASALVLAACQDSGPKTTNLAALDDDIPLVEMLDAEHKTDEDKQIAKGMKAMTEGDYQLASQTFNSLLIDDPMNAQVHTLNGLNYHLMAKRGDVAKIPLAQAGFEQAFKIDPHNTIAVIQLGRIAADKKDYIKAQEFFSTALLIDSKNADAQFELASASYQLGDLKTASMSIDRALTMQPDSPHNVRAASLIYAALGNEEQAQIYVSKYSTLPVNKRHKKHLEQRVEDWSNLHKSGRLMASADPAATPAAAETMAAPEAAPASEPTVEAVAQAEPLKKPEQHIYVDKQEDMIVVDAVIMRVSETGTTKKGNNIMESLTMSLSPFNYFKARNTSGGIKTGADIFPKNNGSTSTGVPDAESETGYFNAATGTAATLITQGISFGTINYSLNIANSSDNYVEIIGRPSLTATVGKDENDKNHEAAFFSGRTKHIAVAGQFGGNITETPIGTTLKIKKADYKDGFITLEVELEGSSIAQVVGSVSSNSSTSTEFDLNKDTVTTTVKVKAGESVILAGITQRELSTGKSGFPILQNIPGIQYLFSEEISVSDRKSVMYILTPRSYTETITQTKRFFQRGEEFGKRPQLAELEMRHKDWYDPSINNTLILQHLGPVYGEFRTGDLHDIKWGHDDDVTKQLTSIANFIWY